METDGIRRDFLLPCVKRRSGSMTPGLPHLHHPDASELLHEAGHTHVPQRP